MSKRWIASAFLITGLAFACGGGKGGGGSGVAGSKKVIDLNMAEVDSLCAFVAATFPSRNVTCSGQTVMFGTTKADCIASSQTSTSNPNCTATVAQSEACANALGDLTDAQVCAIVAGTATLPTACAPLNTPECAGG